MFLSICISHETPTILTVLEVCVAPNLGTRAKPLGCETNPAATGFGFNFSYNPSSDTIHHVMKSVREQFWGVRTDMQLMWIRVGTEVGYMWSFHEKR